VIGVWPSVTYPSHATLVTGVSPERHGILYNKPFDPLGRADDGTYWFAEDLRVPTLWDVAEQSGLRTASVDWPVTIGANISHDIVQYGRAGGPRTSDEQKLFRALSGHGRPRWTRQTALADRREPHSRCRCGRTRGSSTHAPDGSNVPPSPVGTMAMTRCDPRWTPSS
jgi:arylsulfatase A-like enzyme